MSQSHLAIFVMCGGLLLSACSSGEGGRARPGPATNGGDRGESVVVATFDGEGPGLLGLAEGKIEVNGGCLYLQGNGTRILPVFPVGSASWNGSALVFNGTEFAEGDTVQLGGGSYVLEKLPNVSVPPSCVDAQVFAVTI